MRLFQSTKPGVASEDRKAHFKNYNLPILNYIYNGDEKKEIYCCISKTPGFKDVWCPVRKKERQVFRIDFDHIRQKHDTYRKASGVSIDKTEAPSSIFRAYPLDNPVYKQKLIEMMCCWPLCTEEHSYKSNSSQWGNIVLNNYPKKLWPWHLKNKKNFDKVCDKFKLDLDYHAFIEALNDINAPCIPSEYGRLLRQQQFERLFVEGTELAA